MNSSGSDPFALLQSKSESVKHLILDAGAFITGAKLDNFGADMKYYILADVIREVKDEVTRHRMQTFPYKLHERSVSDEALKAVVDFARKTGDIASLSATDLRVLGLVYMLEKENHGVAHLRTQPQTHRSAAQQLPHSATASKASSTASSSVAQSPALSAKSPSPAPAAGQPSALSLGGSASLSSSQPAGGAAVSLVSKRFADDGPVRPFNVDDFLFLSPQQVEEKAAKQRTQTASKPKPTAGDSKTSTASKPAAAAAVESKAASSNLSLAASLSLQPSNASKPSAAAAAAAPAKSAWGAPKAWGKPAAPTATASGHSSLSLTASSETEEFPSLPAPGKQIKVPMPTNADLGLATPAEVAAAAAAAAAKPAVAASAPVSSNSLSSSNSAPLTAAALRPTASASDGASTETDDTDADDAASDLVSVASSSALLLRGAGDAAAVDGGAVGDDDDDDEDAGEWITPDNVAAHVQADGAAAAGAGANGAKSERAPSSVACVTTDYAMQNVLLQMGLRVLSVAGYAITSLRQFVLRCHACFTVCKQMERQFCPHCGHNTLVKASVFVDQRGVAHVRPMRKHISTRGTKYSVPKARGGRYNNDLKLSEDEFGEKAMLQQRRQQKEGAKNKGEKDLFKDALEFGMQKAAPARKDNVVGYGRTNPNVVRPRTGNKKKKRRN